MEYCRSLSFDQEPNYATCVGFFTTCLQRHGFDGHVYDYTWKQNRLSKDKEALKNSMLNVIRKRPKNPAIAGTAVSILMKVSELCWLTSHVD